MKQMVLISDHVGYPLRAVNPSRVIETIVIGPSDKAPPHAVPIDYPESWLPTILERKAGWRNQWWVCDRLYVRAIMELGLDADYYWCVEGDVVAKEDTWRRLMAASSNRRLDGIFLHLTYKDRNKENPFFGFPTTPKWATNHCLGAMYRLSRRAVQWLQDSAQDHRNIFCEINAPTTIHLNKGSIGDMSQLGRFYTRQCMKGTDKHLGLHTGMFCHPVKLNSVDFEFTIPYSSPELALR